MTLALVALLEHACSDLGPDDAAYVARLLRRISDEIDVRLAHISGANRTVRKERLQSRDDRRSHLLGIVTIAK
jgi:hypothetical protein